MNLRPYQIQAAAALKAEIAKGGPLTFSMPIGSGRSIVVAEAVRSMGPVAFLSRHREIAEQNRDLCQRMGVTNVKSVWTPGRIVPDLGAYDVVILSEEHRTWPEIDHPCVIQQGFIPTMPFTMTMARGTDLLPTFIAPPSTAESE